MKLSSTIGACLLATALLACGNSGSGPTGTAGTSGGGAGSGAGTTGAAGSSAGTGAGSAGVTGASGTNGGAGTTGAAGNAGAAGRTDGGSADVPPAVDAQTDGGVAPSAESWPMFGRDFANTRATSDTSIGKAQLGTLRVAQRVTGAGVSSTAAIVDGVVYYADYAGWLRAVDAQTGAAVWSTRVQNTMLTPSPFVTSDTVYIAGDNSVVYAVSRDKGVVKWQTKIETTSNNRIWSSPIVVGNTLIIGAGSYQVFIPATPVFRGSIVGLDVTNKGAEKWRVSVCPVGECGGGVSVWSSVAVDTTLKLAYIGTGQAYSAPAGPYSDSVVAINYETGTRAWHYQITPNDTYNINVGAATKDRDVGAAPNLFEANINGTMRRLVGVGDKGGHYTALDRETGAMVWQRLTDTRTPPGSPIGGVMGAPAVANGRIYLTNNTSTTGGSRSDARPGTCTAFALDAATGSVVWSTPISAGSFSGNTIVNGLMYFVTWDGQLRVLDADNGSLLKSVTLGTAIGVYDELGTQGFPNGSTSGPVVMKGRIYAGFGWTWGAAISGGLAIIDTGAN
jgi:polyvinyl alcohol dehydrogenase (cytochrome)